MANRRLSWLEAIGVCTLLALAVIILVGFGLGLGWLMFHCEPVHTAAPVAVVASTPPVTPAPVVQFIPVPVQVPAQTRCTPCTPPAPTQQLSPALKLLDPPQQEQTLKLLQ